ncbi:MAG: hypothetical protein IJS32_09625 [Kiritimatiellae bacterium]|nr:hypothetical protein [Kiritimatiellia bacterium]
MKKYVSLVLLIALCCAIPAFAARGIIAADSADNYTPATFGNGAQGEATFGFQPWVCWGAIPTLADSTAGVCGDINSANGYSFRCARNADTEYSNGYLGFDELKTGDVLTFKFTCAYCAGGRGLDLFANGGHEESDKIANVIHLTGDNEYYVNNVLVTNNWAPHAVSEVTVTQLDDGIKIAIKRTSTEPGVDVLEYETTVDTAKKLTGIGIYAYGWDWNGGADVENYAFYANDFQIEGDLPEGGALTLVEDSGDWLVNTPEATTFNYTVSIPEAVADDVQVQLGLEGSFGELSARSVTIPAGETSATFTVTAQVNRSGNYAKVTVSAENYSSASEQIYGPSISWSMQVTHTGTQTEDYYLDGGDTVQFWINNNADTATPANAYVTASTTDGDVLSCSALAEWADADPDPGTYTSGTLTAIAPAAETQSTFQIKFGDVVFHEYTFTVFPAPAPIVLDGPASLTVGETATVTVTANDLDGATLNVQADDDGTYVTLGGEIPLYPEDTPWTGTFTVTAVAPGTATITVYDEDDESVSATLEITVSAFVPALSLAPSEGYSWAVTSPDTEVEFTVTCNRAPESALTLEITNSPFGDQSQFDITLPAAGSVVIPAGETSTTFKVGVKATGNNNAITITAGDVLDGGYTAGSYDLKGPNFRWSRSLGDDWQIALGTEVQFWINDDDNNFEAANASVTATVRGTAITLDPWADAGEGGKYTSGKFTASASGSWPLVIKYGDAQLFDWGYYVEGSGETVSVNLGAPVFADGKVVLTADQDLTGNTATVYTASDLANPDWQPAGTATIDGATITVEGLSVGEEPLFLRIGQ